MKKIFLCLLVLSILVFAVIPSYAVEDTHDTMTGETVVVELVFNGFVTQIDLPYLTVSMRNCLLLPQAIVKDGAFYLRFLLCVNYWGDLGKPSWNGNQVSVLGPCWISSEVPFVEDGNGNLYLHPTWEFYKGWDEGTTWELSNIGAFMYCGNYPLGNKPSDIVAAEYEYITPIVFGVTLTSPSATEYYAGEKYQFGATVSGAALEVVENADAVFWYVRGNNSPDTSIDNDGMLEIAADETSTELDIELISAFDPTKSVTKSLTITYPLLGSMISPSGTQTFVESSKRQELQFELILPNGEPFNYTDVEWTTQGNSDYLRYFRIDDQGLLVIEPNAPVGASCTVHFAYGFDTDNVSPVGATVKIVSTQEGIYDNLTPTPEQNDKAENMEDAIGGAADKLENNNSSLGQLTPTRPQINTNLEFDQDQMLAVSPLVTNIWSINGLGRMISIVLVVATVAYIFFGKRDG